MFDLKKKKKSRYNYQCDSRLFPPDLTFSVYFDRESFRFFCDSFQINVNKNKSLDLFFFFSSSSHDSSEPGVPGGVHPAQVVQAVGGGNQCVHFAFPPLELSQVVEAGHDGGDGLLDQ